MIINLKSHSWNYFQILLIHHKLPQLKTIVQYTGLPPLADQRRLHKSHGKHILSWEELSEIGKALPDNKLGEKWCYSHDNEKYENLKPNTPLCASI